MTHASELPSGVPFQRPDRAGKNLGLLRERLGEDDYPRLLRLLRPLPDPDAALDYLERFSGQGDEAVAILSGVGRNLHAALTAFSNSNFLSEVLVRQPTLLAWSLEPERFDRLMSGAELRSEMGWIPERCDDEEAARILARFKRIQLLRIGLRDLLGEADLGEVVLELSNLADAMLQGALEHIRGQLVRRFGRPMIAAGDAAIEGRFAVLALGKLGGCELNYSSDIDLMYLHTGDGETSGPVKISNHDFYGQLATRLTNLLSAMTPEGFAYRVDLRLRPEGSAGELVSPLEGAVSYYHTRARDWELQMLIKARPAAGDTRLGAGFLSMVRPLIYQTTTDFSMIEKVSESRDRIQSNLRSKLTSIGRVDVKLTAGGIRDIEFLVQCLQRLYGGRDPFVRSGGTLFALHRLHEKGYLSMPDYSRLSSAYQYLRTLEHRLQLLDNRQTHELPSDPAALRLVERKMHGVSYSLSATEKMLDQVHTYFRQVREIYERTIHSQRPTKTIPAPAVEESQPIPEEAADHSWRIQLRHIERGHPDLAAAIDALEIHRGGKIFSHLIDKIVGMPELLKDLSRNPALLECVADLIEHSPYLGEHLVRYPDDIRELLDIAQGRSAATESESQPPDMASLDAHPETACLGDQGCGYAEKSMLLRRFYRRQMLRVLADSVYCGRPVFTTLARTSDLAEWVVRAAYRIACEESEKKSGRTHPNVQMQVVALGRLGMREFDLGSDADLAFVVPDEAFADIPWWTDCVGRMIDVISSYTREGVIFSVDARLRPLGRDGDLVQTESAFLNYFQDHAQAWEALSYMKARTVAGDLDRGRNFLQNLQEVGWKRFGLSGDLGPLLRTMRQKLETEQGRKTPLKAGAGGYYDIDFILLYLRLKSAGLFFEYLSTPRRIDIVRAGGELTDVQAEQLKQAATFFRSLDHAIRTVTGQSSSTVPAMGSLQQSICSLLGRWSSIEPCGRALPELVDEVRGRTRELYQAVFE